MSSQQYTVALAAYSEIILKSRVVRRRFEEALTRNVKAALKSCGVAYYDIRTEGGRITIRGVDVPAICRVLNRVFGIDFASPALAVSHKLHDVVDAAVNVARDTLQQGDTFAVRAKRVGSHPYTSKDIEVEAGRVILEQLGGERRLKVNLTAPRHTIYVEVRELEAYIYGQKIQGPSGLPYGTQGEAISLLTCDGLSAVAAWLMMKRGVQVGGVHFTLNDQGENGCLTKVEGLAAKLASFTPSGKMELYVVPFANVKQAVEMAEGVTPADREVILKRCMLKAASKLGAGWGIEALVVGDWISGPESYVAKALPFSWDASKLVLFQPLLGFSRETIAAMASPLGLTESEMCFKENQPADQLTLNVETVQTYEAMLRLDELTASALSSISKRN